MPENAALAALVTQANEDDETTDTVSQTPQLHYAIKINGVETDEAVSPASSPPPVSPDPEENRNEPRSGWCRWCCWRRSPKSRSKLTAIVPTAADKDGHTHISTSSKVAGSQTAQGAAAGQTQILNGGGVDHGGVGENAGGTREGREGGRRVGSKGQGRQGSKGRAVSPPSGSGSVATDVRNDAAASGSSAGARNNNNDGDRQQQKRLVSPRPRGSTSKKEGPQLVEQVYPNIGRKTLVLDLDETLVHSSFRPVENADIVITVEIEGEHHKVYVRKRPGVDEFLVQVAKKYEVVVYTASMAKYANPLLDKLDPFGTVAHRLFREACTRHPSGYVKDLSKLGRDLKHVIIIDNSPVCYALQPENAIPIKTWRDDMSDTELVDLVPILLSVADVDDIPRVLKQIIWTQDDMY